MAWRFRRRPDGQTVNGALAVRAAPGKDETYAAGEYRPNLLGRFFLWCGGFDRSLLHSRVEGYRASGIGIFVVLVAITASGSFGLYSSVIFGAFDPRFIPFALFWGLLVFFVDRSILVDPHYGRVADERGGAAARVPAYAMRFGLAIVVALLVSESLLLVVFHPEIEKEITRQRSAEYSTAIATAGEEQAAGLRDQNTQLRTQLVDADTPVDQADSVMKDARTEYNLEVGGKISGVVGKGSKSDREWRAYLDAERAYHDAVRVRDKARGQITAALQANATLEKQLRDTSSPQYAALVTSEQGRAAAAARDAPRGWLDQERALHRFQQRPENRGDPAVVLIPWLLRALLVIIDLIPLTMKMLGGTSIYGRRLRDQGADLRHADRLYREHHREAVERDLRIKSLSHQADEYLHAERLDNYRRTRADHLRPPRSRPESPPRSRPESPPHSRPENPPHSRPENPPRS